MAFTSLQTMKEIGVFWLHCTACGNQEVFTSAGKNTEIVLVSCPTWKRTSVAVSGGMDISEVPGCHLLQQMSSQ